MGPDAWSIWTPLLTLLLATAVVLFVIGVTQPGVRTRRAAPGRDRAHKAKSQEPQLISSDVQTEEPVRAEQRRESDDGIQHPGEEYAMAIQPMWQQQRQQQHETSTPDLQLLQHSLLHDSPAGQVEALTELLQEFFRSTDSLSDWVAQGGLAALGRLMPAVSTPVMDSMHQALVLQVSWLLLQVAHSPLASRRKLHDHIPAHLLHSFLSSLLQSRSVPHSLQSAVMRNCCWTLSSMCDVSWLLCGAQRPTSGSGSARTAQQREEDQAMLAIGVSYTRAVAACGLLPTLRAALGSGFGADAASFSAALLASMSLLEEAEPAAAASAQQLLLQPGTSQLLCALLASNRHGRVQALLCHYLNHMLLKHPSKLVWQLVYDRAVQDLLKAVPGQLGQLAVYQLLSPEGQDTMVEFESQYCVDVPVALSHALTSELANRLVRIAVAHTDDEAVSDAGLATRTVSLRALASRMLLAGERLEELVHACFDELAEAEVSRPQASPGGPLDRETVSEPLFAARASMDRPSSWDASGRPWSERPSPARGVPGRAAGGKVEEAAASQGSPPWVTDTVTATTQLLCHLQLLDLQLAAYRGMYGAGVEDRSSMASSFDRASDRASRVLVFAPRHLQGTDAVSERSWRARRPLGTDAGSEHGVPAAQTGTASQTGAAAQTGAALPGQQLQPTAQRQGHQQPPTCAGSQAGREAPALPAPPPVTAGVLTTLPLSGGGAVVLEEGQEAEAGSTQGHGVVEGGQEADARAQHAGDESQVTPQDSSLTASSSTPSGQRYSSKLLQSQGRDGSETGPEPSVSGQGGTHSYMGAEDFAAADLVMRLRGRSMSASMSQLGAGDASPLLPAAVAPLSSERVDDQTQAQGHVHPRASDGSPLWPAAEAHLLNERVDAQPQVQASSMLPPSNLLQAQAQALGHPALAPTLPPGGDEVQAGPALEPSSSAPALPHASHAVGPSSQAESGPATIAAAPSSQAHLPEASTSGGGAERGAGAGAGAEAGGGERRGGGAGAGGGAGGGGELLALSYGSHQVLLSSKEYSALRRLSGLLHLWISRSSPRDLHKVLRVPSFTDQENCVAVRALVAAALGQQAYQEAAAGGQQEAAAGGAPWQVEGAPQQAGLLSQGMAGPLSQGMAGPLSQGMAGPLSQGMAGPLSQGMAGPLSQGMAGPAQPAAAGPLSEAMADTTPQERAGAGAGLLSQSVAHQPPQGLEGSGDPAAAPAPARAAHASPGMGGVAPSDALLVWQAADYYQVDALKEHCEDLLISALVGHLVPAARAATSASMGMGMAGAASGRGREEGLAGAFSAPVRGDSLAGTLSGQGHFEERVGPGTGRGGRGTDHGRLSTDHTVLSTDCVGPSAHGTASRDRAVSGGLGVVSNGVEAGRSESFSEDCEQIDCTTAATGSGRAGAGYGLGAGVGDCGGASCRLGAGVGDAACGAGCSGFGLGSCNDGLSVLVGKGRSSTDLGAGHALPQQPQPEASSSGRPAERAPAPAAAPAPAPAPASTSIQSPFAHIKHYQEPQEVQEHGNPVQTPTHTASSIKSPFLKPFSQGDHGLPASIPTVAVQYIQEPSGAPSQAAFGLYPALSDGQSRVPPRRSMGEQGPARDGERGAPPHPQGACYEGALARLLSDILDVVARYHHSSARLQHLLAVWLMGHMHRLVSSHAVAVVLSKHKGELVPSLVSEMRDRLVGVVMLSDTLDDEPE